MARPGLRDWLALAAFILLSLTAATTGVAFPPGAWYASLVKPAWNPPSWLFGPVWTTLYVLMGTAAWRVWRQRGEQPVKPALTAWGLQLALNALWTPLFFGLHWMGWACVEIVGLLLAILVTTGRFARVDRAAAAMLWPYALWVTFAAALNFELWRINP